MSFAEPETDQDETAEREASDRRSLLASGVAALILIFAILMFDAKWLDSVMMLFFAGASLAVSIWGVAWFFALRHGSNWMGLITFIGLLFFSLGGMSWKYWSEYRGSSHENDRSRYKMVDTLYSAPGAIEVVADAGGGSLTIIGRYLNNILKDRNSYSKLQDELGMMPLLQMPQFSDDAQLKKCSEYAELRSISEAAKQNAHAHSTATRTEIQRSDLGTRHRAQLLAEYDIVQKIYLPMQDRLWTIRAEISDAAGRRCAILARRNWRNNGSGLLFTNEADYKADIAATQRLGVLFDEEADIQNAALRKTVDQLNAL
jgi:hypothetical protein